MKKKKKKCSAKPKTNNNFRVPVNTYSLQVDGQKENWRVCRANSFYEKKSTACELQTKRSKENRTKGREKSELIEIAKYVAGQFVRAAKAKIKLDMEEPHKTRQNGIHHENR